MRQGRIVEPQQRHRLLLESQRESRALGMQQIVPGLDEQRGWQAGKPFGAGETATGLEEKLAEWQAAGDRRLFKLILSPEFGHRLDLQQFTRDLIQGIEQRTGTKLEWVAVVHNNTEHPHVHVALRGVAGGQDLRLDRDLIRNGMREHAERLCTLALGYRTEQDVLEAQRKEVGFSRATSLDRQIQKRAVPVSPTEAHIAIPPGNREFFQLLACRMAALTKMGLAQPNGSGWRLRLDFLQVLKAMQQDGDRQKMLNQCGILLSDPRLPTQMTRLKNIRHLEGRVIAHINDDVTGAPHMILEGTDARVHFIRHSSSMEVMRCAGSLKPNSFVVIRRAGESQSQVKFEEFGDADKYLASNHIRDKARRLIQRGIVGGESEEYGGWLGKYYRTLAEATDPAQPHPVVRIAPIPQRSQQRTR